MKKASNSLEDKLKGLGFGAGVAVMCLDGERPVETAVVDASNTVRLTTGSKMRAGGVLEAHYLFKELRFGDSAAAKVEDRVAAMRSPLGVDYGPMGVLKQDRPVPTYLGRHVSWGPMATIELGTDVIRSIGLGLIVAMQKYSVDANGVLHREGVPLNIGVVGFAEPNVKRVRGGYTDGQLVAAGTTLQLEETHRYGWGVVISTRF